VPPPAGGAAGAGVAVVDGAGVFEPPGVGVPAPPDVDGVLAPVDVVLGAVLAGAGSVLVVVVAGGSPLRARAAASRCWSIDSAETMKARQISAGNVPPSTGAPPKSVFIDLVEFG